MKLTVAVLTLVASVAQARPWMALDLNSWSALKQMCENYKDFGAQVPPEDIQVKCEMNTQYTEVIRNTEVKFPGYGSVTISISSSKANVAPSRQSLPVPGTVVACPVVARFAQRASGTFPSSCEELKEYKGSYADFCVEKLKGPGYKGEAELVPGSERSLCAAGSQYPEKPQN
jgi:hypothetical protein